jgi:hypothetical protein
MKSDQERIRALIAEYMEAGNAPETSRIADYISAKIIIRPSRTTIGIILRKMGYEPIEQPRFVWRHNPNKAE